jgi:hypothetical protein
VVVEGWLTVVGWYCCVWQTQTGVEKVKVRVSTASGEYVFYIAVKDVFVWTRKARQFLNLCSNFMADGATRPSGYCVEHRACSPLCATKM